MSQGTLKALVFIILKFMLAARNKIFSV